MQFINLTITVITATLIQLVTSAPYPNIQDHLTIPPEWNPEIIHVTYPIGGLFSVHNQYNVDDTGKTSCSDISLKELMRSQAMMWAIQKSNIHLAKLAHPITLNYYMVDDCHSIDEAVKASMMFMMGWDADKRSDWLKTFRQMVNLKAEGTCPKNSACPTKRRGQVESPVYAVVGAGSSDISSAVSSVLSVNMIPMVSYASTSPQLSNKRRYPSFMRTIPSDDLQVQAFYDLLVHFNFTWIAVLATDDTYGRTSLQALKALLHDRQGPCLALEKYLDPTMSDPETIKSVLRELDANVTRRATAVIMIANGDYIENFTKYAKEVLKYPKTFIASESWGFNVINPSYQSVLKGALGLFPYDDFPWQFFNETMEMNINDTYTQNSLFGDYFRQILKCSDPKCLELFKKHVGRLGPPGMIRFRDVWNLVLDAVGGDKASFRREMFSSCTAVINAVNAIANAIENAIEKQTEKQPEPLQPLDLTKSLFALQDVPSCCVKGKSFSFNSNGDLIDSGYYVTNAKHDGDETTLEFMTIGHWFKSSNLTLDTSEVESILGKGLVPASVCGIDCTPGHFKTKTGIRCCWDCPKCPEGKFSNSTNAKICYACDEGMVSEAGKSFCYYPQYFIDWSSPGEIVAICLACAGFLLTIVTSTVIGFHRTTSVVVASNRPLTYILLFSLAVAFTLPPILYIRPMRWLCALESVIFGSVFITITGILLVKTWHVRMIFSAKFKKTTHLMSQKVMFRRELWLCALIVIVYWTMATPFIVLNQPQPLPNKQDCGSAWITLQVVSTCVICVLSLAATYIGFRARKLPENYNESKYLCTTMLLLILVWVGTFPSYFRLPAVERTLYLSVAVDAAGLIVLLMMFGPKIYIIYFEPWKNTQAYVKRTNMLHIWKKHSKSEMLRKRLSQDDNHEDVCPRTNDDDDGIFMRDFSESSAADSTITVLPDVVPRKTGLAVDRGIEVPIQAGSDDQSSKDAIKRRFKEKRIGSNKSQVSFADTPTMMSSDPVQFPKSMRVSDSLADPSGTVFLLSVTKKDFD